MPFTVTQTFFSTRGGAEEVTKAEEDCGFEDALLDFEDALLGLEEGIGVILAVGSCITEEDRLLETRLVLWLFLEETGIEENNERTIEDISSMSAADCVEDN